MCGFIYSYIQGTCVKIPKYYLNCQFNTITIQKETGKNRRLHFESGLHVFLCLFQAVIYEIPSLKKQIAKQEKQIKELDKLEESVRRRIAELHSLRKTDCSRLGIKGEEPKKEIFEIVSTLPDLYDQWINRAQPKLASFMSAYKSAASIHRNTGDFFKERNKFYAPLLSKFVISSLQCCPLA